MENLFLWNCILYVHHFSPIPFFSCPPLLCFALLPLTSTVVQCTVDDLINLQKIKTANEQKNWIFFFLRVN